MEEKSSETSVDVSKTIKVAENAIKKATELTAQLTKSRTQSDEELKIIKKLMEQIKRLQARNFELEEKLIQDETSV